MECIMQILPLLVLLHRVFSSSLPWCAVVSWSIQPSNEYQRGINQRMSLQPPPEYIFSAHVDVHVAPCLSSRRFRDGAAVVDDDHERINA
jgi:hypothetical protein